jgi:hypothetical protein
MRIHIPCTALGLALAVVAPAAHAETVVTRQIVSQPVETVRTVTTTRTVRPIIHRRVVVTRRTTVSERVAPLAPPPAPAAVATTYQRPIYDVVAPRPPAPVPYPRPVYDVVAPAPPVVTPYPRPVYDVVTPAPAVAAPVVDETVVAPAPAVAPLAVGTAMPAYRYVYEPDRILVIDPATGIAVQALPR